MCPISTAPIRAFLYARSGGELQNAPTAKVDEQLHRLRRYAFERSYVVVGEASDASSPGSTLSRPGLEIIISGSTCMPPLFDLLLATNATRLARGPVVLNEVTSRLESAGIKIEYADDSHVEPSAVGHEREYPQRKRLEDLLRPLLSKGEDLDE